MSVTSYIGRPLRRIEDEPLVRGEGRFVDDIHLPGMLEAGFVRSPHAHARVLSIDATKARAHPGVRAVYTLADLGSVLTNERLPLQFRSKELPDDITPFVLAKEEVAFAGEAVAIVVAESRYVAEDVAALVDVQYEPLPAISDCRAASQPDAPRARASRPSNILAEFSQRYGDVEGAFTSAPRRLTLNLKQHRGGAHPIEGRGIVARYESFEDRLTVWSSTQLAHELRTFLVALLGLDENRVRVITPDVGGGFGAKFLMYPEEVAVSAAALLLRAPIKWIEDRREHFMSAIQERDQYWDMEIAFDDEGRLLGARGTMIHDQGAYTPQGINLPYNASTAFPGPYVLPAYELRVKVAETNKVAALPVRGAGYPEGTFAMERSLDRIADTLGLDRAEVRRRNLVQPEHLPYSTPLKTRSGAAVAYDSGDFPLCQRTVLETIGHEAFPKRQADARAQGRYIGLGIANGIKGTGRGPFESGLVRIGRSGRISVYTGAMPMGQGLCTALAQICAEQFGVEPKDISVIAGDTGTIPLGVGGFASRQTVTAGSSVHLAAKAVREKLLRVAGHLLEAAVEDLELRDGRVHVRGIPGHGVTIKQIAEMLAGAPGYAIPGGFEPTLESAQHFMPSALTYGMGSHAVEVEVDPETGAVAITRYVVANDCGRVINPMIVEGQIVGGVVHGIGNGLFEWMGYDDQAQPITVTLAEYLIPTATEVPDVEVKLLEFPSPLNPIGVKGVGEAGCVPAAAAIVSAVESALSPWKVVIEEAPISPARLFALMQGRQKSA
jgi:carbon-monoxide dehydrogenase large subunit